MKALLLSLVCTLFLAAAAFSGEAPRYAVATTPAPVLNTPDFPGVFGGSVRLDPCQGVRPIEFIALSGTLFRIEGEERRGGITVYRVTSTDYPYASRTGYYVDSRFLRQVEGSPRERTPVLPSREKIRQALMGALGRPYVWGGNVKDGVPLLARYYPDADRLAGVDCSGLLFEATDGYTPRNTSTLTGYGDAVPVAGLTADEIAERVKPLDLLVWKGHVMVVVDRETVIQSTMGCAGVGGVHATPLREELRRLMKSRRPLDRWVPDSAQHKGFVVRRWYPGGD